MCDLGILEGRCRVSAAECALEGGVRDLWWVVAEARGQDSLITEAWPLAFLCSRSTTAACGCLATSCRDLRGSGGVEEG